jgi:hypothetical protein
MMKNADDRLEPDVVELEEITRPDLVHVVPEERRPALPPGTRTSKPAHVLLDGPLRHVDAELQQLTSNPFGSRERVLVDESSNQLDRLRGDSRRRGRWRPGSRSPEQTETLAVPTEDGVGLHEKYGVAPARNEMSENHEERPVVSRELRLLRRPHHDDELLAEERVLREEFFRRAGQVPQQPADERDGPRRGPQGRIDALGYPACGATNPPNQRRAHDLDLVDLAVPFRSCASRIS